MTVVQEYWDHYPYTGPTGAWIECLSAGAIAGKTRPPRCGQGNFRAMPTPADIVPAVFTDAYAKTGETPCDFSCPSMISGNYVDAGLTYKGSGFSFVEAVRETWITYMQSWYATVPAEPLFDPNKDDYTPWVQSIWRNPEQQEANSIVINSDHQFGSGIDFLHKNSFGAGRPPYTFDIPDRAATNICLLAWAAWDSGGTKQTIVENINDSPNELFTWGPSTVINECVSGVNQRILACLEAKTSARGDFAFNATPTERQLCSPTHVHSARPND